MAGSSELKFCSILILLVAVTKAQATTENDPWFDVTDAEVLRLDRFRGQGQPSPQFYSGPYDYTWLVEDQLNAPNLLQANMKTNATLRSGLQTLSTGLQQMSLPSGGLVSITSDWSRCPLYYTICNPLVHEDCRAQGFTSMIDGSLQPQDNAYLPTVLAEVQAVGSIDAVQRPDANNMHTHYWCVHGNCDPAVATEIVNIPGMTILTRVQIVGTSFFRPGLKLDNPQSNEPAYKALCYIGPDEKRAVEVEMKFASNEAIEGIANRANYHPLELAINVGKPDFFLVTNRLDSASPAMVTTHLMRNVIRLRRLPRLRRAMISFRHICGTDVNGPFLPTFIGCQLGVQLAKADHPDGFEQDFAFVPDPDLFNDGSVKVVSNWKSAIFAIPPIFDRLHRAQVVARYGPLIGFAALDDIKITTREMCSPRWTKFPGLGFKTDILSKVDTSLDDFETSGIDNQKLLEKYAMVSSTASLEGCTRLCFFGSGCDMVEFDPVTSICRFFPHLTLKSEVWFHVVQENTPTDMFILQCSTSQENILYNNDFWNTVDEPWQINHNCSTTELGIDSAMHAEIGSQTSNAIGTWDFVCNTNRGFKVSATLDPDLFPFGINQPYLNSVGMSGLVVGWVQGFSDPMISSRAIKYHLDIEDGTPIVVDEMESLTQWPLSKSLTNVANQLTKTVSLTYRSQHPSQKSRVAPINFLVDMPINLGCFAMTQEALVGLEAPMVAPDMTPVKCLTHCATAFPSPLKRFSGLSNANECRCFEEIPIPDLTLLPDFTCTTPCAGDEFQFCGGNTSTFQFFVSRCPESQQRFGDYCYLENNLDLSIEENADFCAEQDMHLFWPDSIAETLFVSEILPKAQRHVGFMYVTDNEGIIAADGSILTGNGATHLPLDGSPIVSISDHYQMTNISCHVLDQDAKVRSLSPCSLATGALCKAKIAQGAGSEYLGSSNYVDIYSPIQTTPQQTFGTNLPLKIELKGSAYPTNKWIDFKFPQKLVIKALRIETLKAKYLKSFYLKVAEVNFAKFGDLTYIEFKAGQPVLFSVFHKSAENINNVMARTIPLVRPRMTRHLQLEIVESAFEVAVNLDIIGMTSKKAYAANKYLEEGHEFHTTVPGTDLALPFFDLDLNTPLYPNGKLFYRGWINDITQNKDIVRLELSTPSGNYFKLLVSAEKTVYRLAVDSNLITINPINGSILWKNYRPFQTLAFEVEFKFTTDSLILFFKGDHILTFSLNSVFLNEPIFSRFTQGTNGTTSRIQFASTLQYGAFDEFRMSNNVDFPSTFDPPTLIPLSMVVDKEEGFLFQLFGDPAGKNFGYIPFEFKGNCFETPHGNVRCVPGSGIMATKPFGRSPEVNNGLYCPSGYDFLGKICVKTFTSLPTYNYAAAKSYCAPDHVYIPKDQDHNRLFRAAMKSIEATLPLSEIWIGVTRLANGTWITEEQNKMTPLTSDWAPGYPDELDGQANCAMASQAHGFKWINGNCNQLKVVYCTLRPLKCPRGYEWLPQIPNSCFRINSVANHLIAPGSYSNSIHNAEDMCQMEHTRLHVIETLEQGKALSAWVANSPHVSFTSSTFWTGMHEVEVGAYIFANQYDPSATLSEDSGFFADGGSDRSCLRMIASSGDPSQIGRVHAQECASLANQKFHGICQYTQCIAQNGNPCQFPFRFQNRMYDCCITLGSSNGSPWCSGSTDVEHNHIPGNELQCPDTCHVNNCPIGYRRIYKDQSCYKLSPPHPSKTASSVVDAQGQCNKDGAKLLEPRSEDFWPHFLKLESHFFSTGQHFKHSGEASFVAIGLFVNFSTGAPVAHYSDGTTVPELLAGSAIPWRSGFPEDDPSKTCVALMSSDGKLINIPCQGFSQGDGVGHGDLRYLCEARPTQAIDVDGKENVCHFPFRFNNVTYHGCVGPDVAAPENVLHSWCATKVDVNGFMEPGQWAFCSDERSIALSNLDGHYCSVPFLMNQRFYETCTRHTSDSGVRLDHYWCANKNATSLTVSYQNGMKGKCPSFLIPKNNGCPDHFDLAGNTCVRISTFAVTFDQARLACAEEDAELLTILDDQISKDIQVLLQKKRQYFQHYSKTNAFWVGAEYRNGWHWMNNRTNKLKPFGPFTHWKRNISDFGCPPESGCSNFTKLYVDAADDFSWKAAQRDEKIGYICHSKCPSPYIWSWKLNSCVYAATTPKTVPEAIVDCAKSNGTLYPIRNCADLDVLRSVLLELSVPIGTSYTIGVFHGLKHPWNTRSPEPSSIQNSFGYPLFGISFDPNLGLCLAKEGNMTLRPWIPAVFGLILNESKLITYHEHFNEPNTRLKRQGYVCQLDDNFACPQGYYKYIDSCFAIIRDPKMNMMEANKKCHEDDGLGLASVTHDLDAQVMTEFIKENEPETNITQYWLDLKLDRKLESNVFNAFSDSLSRCNCSDSAVNFYKHLEKCYYKEGKPMTFSEAKTSCTNNGGSLATGVDQKDSLLIIFQFEELNTDNNGMWLGVSHSNETCPANSEDCLYHWTDEARTKIDPNQVKIHRNKNNFSCVRMQNRRLRNTDCSTKLQSLCVRHSCSTDKLHDRMNCTLVERYDSTNRILKSQCSKRGGFICRTNQIQSDVSKERPLGKQLILPLSREIGFQDQSGQDVTLVGWNIGFSSTWTKSSQMGAALFGGKSYINMATGFEVGTGFSIFFTIEIWENSNPATIMDFRDPKDPANGLVIEWRNDSPVFILGNNQGPQEFRPISSSNMADRNTFATYGITYDSITMRGTIFRDNTFGFQNATSDFGGNHFHFDAEDWFQTALSYPGRIGSSRIDPTLSGLHGALSCIQVYNAALSPGQVLELDHCAGKYEHCSEGQIQWHDMCFEMSYRPASFAQAEFNCIARDGNGYKSELIHSLEPELLGYLSRVLKEYNGESPFWVGLDSRAGLGYFESAGVGIKYNESDNFWVEKGAGSRSGKCAMVPEPNGGFLDVSDCVEKNHYFCQRKGKHMVPDDPCPEGFHYYRGTCFLPAKEQMTFENAQEYCGRMGSIVFAAKTNAQLEFVQEYARMEIKRDIWMGVQRGQKQHYIDEDMDVPLRVWESDDQLYSDGTLYEESIHFNFKMGSAPSSRSGPCIYLRASLGYKAQYVKCTREFGFFCEWREPQCPTNHKLAPELGPRSCYQSVGRKGPFKAEACQDPSDELRHLAMPKSRKVLEVFRKKAGISRGSIWLGAQLRENETWIDGSGDVLELPGTLEDLSEEGVWFVKPPSNQTTLGCLQMDANGLLRTKYDEACQNESHPYACEYKACYTTQGKQCVFPFSYSNRTNTGEVTQLTFTKCSTLDVFLPWCATAVDNASNVVDWGFCAPDCPSEDVEVVCLSEPDFPAFVSSTDGPDLVNFTTSYEHGSALVVREMDFVSFECPVGFVFQGSNNITHYAVCHNWEFQYRFDRTARCERVSCSCPPKFSEDSAVLGTTDWDKKISSCSISQGFPLYTNITYKCPRGYIFETPEFLAFGQERTELFVVCDTYADWNVTLAPKCIPINCTDNPPTNPRNDKGNSSWDHLNKTYGHEILYYCPLPLWGYPSTGENSTKVHCMANKHWNVSHIENCKQLPCPKAPPKAPEGGHLWYGMHVTKYKCPNGFEFQGGSGPYMTIECLANRKWRFSEVEQCVPRTCAHPPPLEFMYMDKRWPSKSSKLGVIVTYECPYKKMTAENQSVQFSTCIWSSDDDNMIWFPNSVQECSRSIPLLPGRILLPELPPFTVEYAKTTDYHWPVVSAENTNVLVGRVGQVIPGPVPIGKGPWGFEEATKITDDQCLIKSSFDKPKDHCIKHPANCTRGLSFSIWEKVSYKEEVLNVYRTHDKHYILSTGGDYDLTTKKAYPGFALYHQGMDLVAVLSTGQDVWELRVKGQLENETWSNIGVRWEAHNKDPTLPYSERGGLELFVNAEKVGHSVLPMERPGADEATNDLGSWAEGQVLTPDSTWKGGPLDAPVILIGCHRNSDDLAFRYFRGQSVAFDELSIWTRKLEINRTHDESLYFLGGYMAEFEHVSSEEWFEMMDKVDLEVPSQAAAAGFVVEKFATENSSLETGALNDDNSTDWASSISFDSDFPRTLQQKKDYVSQKKAFSVSAKLLGTANVKTNERAKYLSRRFSILPVVSSPLTDSKANVDGWKSVQLDPSEEGSSRLVRAIDNFVLTFMSSANIDHDEDYPPFYDYELSDMTIHSKAPSYTMSASKIKPQKFQKYGERLQINGFYTSHPGNPNPQWSEVDETIEIPTKIPFINQSHCEGKPFTLLTTIYHGYGKMAPLRRNPGTVQPKVFKLDSKPISVKIRVNPDPKTDNMTKRFDQDCAINQDAMKYSPVKLRFYHNDFMTSKRKLLWFESDLKTNIELRRCVVYNEEFGIYGGWDASQCTTVITEQSSTVCECGTFGTFALIAEMVEDPFVEAEDNWLVILKYVGYTISIIFFLIFIVVVILSSRLWEMFHLMRLNAAICLLLAHISMFVAEIPGIREDRKLNVIFSILQQYWILASAGFLCSEAIATFQAVTAGIIGGKLMGYIPLAYGLPFINIGTTIYIYADDYGRDPRAFIGWENETKWVFFYLQWPLTFLAAFLSLVLLINLATPQTRKDSVMETLTVQAQGLAVAVFIYAATWGFAYPAFMHFPDKEWADFYPIFAILNSWFGLIFFAFMGIGSSKFRRNLMGQYKQKSALMVGYMIPQKEDEDESEFDSMDQTEHTDGGDENPSPEDVEPENGEQSSDQKPLDEDSQLQNDVEAPQDYDDDE